MSDPAAVSALAEALHRHISHYQGHINPQTDLHRVLHEADAEAVLAHPFTPAQRAALAAAVLTPEVLAEALTNVALAGDVIDFGESAPADPDYIALEPATPMEMAENILSALAALRDAGKEPDHE